MSTPDSQISPESLNTSKRLAAYIPVTLARRILRKGDVQPGHSQSCQAATLFADISGFTAMSEEMASDGPRGAEELNRILLSTFTGMIDIIHGMGGAISHFHGDAMAVYFPDEDNQAVIRALACGQRMQEAMSRSFGRVKTSRPPGKDPYFDLTMKIGLGYGSCQESVVGSKDTSLEFVLAGRAVKEAAAAEKGALAGQIVASRGLMEKLGWPAPAAFNVVDQQATAPFSRPILEWTLFEEWAIARLGPLIAPFVSSTLSERLIGSTLSNLAEHRPVTSVFVQFELARLEDPAVELISGETDQLLQQYYLWANAVVTRFGSQSARLNRVLTGDKGNQLHIIFGAPVAPDAPDQAIRCALTLQAEAPSFVVHQQIGLSVGKVFAGPLGASHRCEYTVVGDVVNLSARLAAICQPGQVLVDATTAARVKDLMDCVPLPPVQLKGKQALVTPYRVDGELTGAEPLQAYLASWDKPLVGRDLELKQLREALDKGFRGLGGVVELAGSTGAGKTRLVAAGIRHWLDGGGVAFMGDCQPHTSDIPYGPWRNVWYGFFGLTPQMENRARLAEVVSQTRSLAPESADDVALWGDVLGLPISLTENLAQLQAEARQLRFLDLVRRCIQGRATQQPLLIVLEGLHWADHASLVLIDDLVPQLERHSVVLMLAHRPIHELGLEAIDRPSCTKISIEDLPTQDARELLGHWVGVQHLPDAIEQHLGLRDREGRDSPVNPLFLEESLNVMMAMGVVKIRKQGMRLERPRVDELLLAQMQLPDTIHGLLLARLDRLPTNSRDLLQVASIIGREFALEPLDMITPTIPQRQIMDGLSELAKLQMTRIVTGAPIWVYMFQHAMTHEVAYSSLPYARRQEIHASVAQWLTERHRDNLRPYYAVLAHHYSRADNHVSGLHFALAAARDAQDIFANAEAVQLYKLAESHLQILGVTENWETAVQLYLSRAELFRLQGDYAAAVEDAETALALSQEHLDQERSHKARLLLADFRYRQSRYDDVDSLAKAVITQSTEDTSPDTLARAYHWQGMAAAATRDFAVAQESLEYAVGIFTETDNRKWQALALEAIAFVRYSQGALPLALQAIESSVALSRQFSTPVNVAFAISNIGVIQFALGLAAEAIESYSQTVELARDTSRNTLAFALSNRAEAAAYLGAFADAQADLEEAAALLVEMDDDFGLIGTFLTWGIEYHSALGEWRDARNRLQLARDLIEKRPDSYQEQHARLLLGLGQIELQEADYHQAELLLVEAENVIEANQLTWWRPIVDYLLGRVSKTKNDIDEARAHFEFGLRSVTDGGCPDYKPLLQLELANLEQDEVRRLGYLQRCVQATTERARYVDKYRCYREVAVMLSGYADAKSIELAEHCKAQLKHFGR